MTTAVTSLPAEGAEASERPAVSKVWVAAAAMVGTTIEWYDFFIFGTATALVFNKLFFPAFDPVVATLASFSTFAVGLFARPLGALVFGHFGDRVGRKRMLVASLLLMGVPTTLIGLVPTYQQIGLWSAVILVAIRVCQGIAIGGEWGGAVLMAVEHAPSRRGAFFGSMPQTGTPVALILSTLAFVGASQLPEEQFLSWGWRLPFLASVALVLVGVLVRRRVGESPAFLQLEATGRTVPVPVAEVVRRHLRTVLLAIGAKLGEITMFYLVTVFLLSYVTGRLGVPRGVVLNATLLGSVVMLVTMPLCGYLSDKVSPRVLFGIGSLVLAAFAVPMFLLVDTRDPTAITLAIACALGVVYPLMYAPEASFFAALFPTAVRYTGISISAHVGGAVGGGLAPIVAASLLASYGSALPVGIYLGGLACLAFLCVLLLKPAEKPYSP